MCKQLGASEDYLTTLNELVPGSTSITDSGKCSARQRPSES